uniref:Uncharacterized protein n=1 Tax=Megaselia scalaris TaxID=36166 RepID=T1GWJ2_MEGSC
MCRCCQSCWEDIYWNCIEEKYCYDENIANYNPEEDDEGDNVHNTDQVDGVKVSQKILSNTLAVPTPITTQPTLSDEDFRREIQTNVPMLASEILAVFENSQIFQEHPKLMRVSTQKFGPQNAQIHRQSSRKKFSDTDEEKLIKRLEVSDSEDDRPIEIKPCPSTESMTQNPPIKSDEELVLRPTSRMHHLELPLKSIHQKKTLRNVQSVPYLTTLVPNENKIFSISHAESMSRISMTPEVPSISFSNLPKNYEDTPTVEKFKASTSLYSIQTANEAKATKHIDFSMPRYYRKAKLVATASMENFENIPSITESMNRNQFEKSKRLQVARLQLPPLHIRQKKDDSKNIL